MSAKPGEGVGKRIADDLMKSIRPRPVVRPVRPVIAESLAPGAAQHEAMMQSIEQSIVERSAEAEEGERRQVRYNRWMLAFAAAGVLIAIAALVVAIIAVVIS